MKGKIIVPFMLIFAMCVVAFYNPDDITAEKTDSRFEFNDSVAVSIKGKKSKDVWQNLEIVNDKGDKVAYISNIINDEKIVISPILKTDSKVYIKNLSDYKTDIYKGVVYVQNEWNLNQISRHIFSNREYPLYYGEKNGSGIKTLFTESSKDAAPVETKKSSPKDHSTTNLQEKNVDEADIVKTDGDCIYYVADNTVFIVKNISGKMDLISEIKMESDDEFIQDMYLDSGLLTVITSDAYYENGNHNDKTGVYVYDMTDKKNIRKIGSTSIDGYPIQTRKIGSKLYIVSSHRFYYKKMEKEKKYDNMPNYRLDPDFVNLKKLIYLPNNPSNSITRITAYDINDFTRKDSIYMGNSSNLYMSEKNAYISYETYGFENNKFKTRSTINRFSLNNGDIDYTGRCIVDGYLINQFSMSEKNSTLFVAYTNEEQKNNAVASFDENLTNVGNLSGIAEGERIYSTRFDGNILYMVTFKEVDPLFAIDLSNPANMQMLGYLKIPGYSSYLHPYKDGLLIGFGQDTMTNKNGNVLNDGFKMALFDVKDLKNIKVLDEVLLGDRGSKSPIEYDHKAIMTDIKNSTIGFPIVVTKKDKKVDEKGNIFDDCKVIFNGALVYKIEDDKFKEIGKITHAIENPNSYYNATNIERLIYIGDEIFTFARNEIKSTSRKTWKEIDTLSLVVQKKKQYPTIN